jgi:hypothetical protein
MADVAAQSTSTKTKQTDFFVALRWRDFLAVTEDLSRLKAFPLENQSITMFFCGVSSIALDREVRDKLPGTSGETVMENLRPFVQRKPRLFERISE